MVKPPPFHGGVPSSILGSATNYMPSVRVGEEAALKVVGLKGLAGSNPVDGAKWLGSSTVRIQACHA